MRLKEILLRGIRRRFHNHQWQFEKSDSLTRSPMAGVSNSVCVAGRGTDGFLCILLQRHQYRWPGSATAATSVTGIRSCKAQVRFPPPPGLAPNYEWFAAAAELLSDCSSPIPSRPQTLTQQQKIYHLSIHLFPQLPFLTSSVQPAACSYMPAMYCSPVMNLIKPWVCKACLEPQSQDDNQAPGSLPMATSHEFDRFAVSETLAL